MKLLPKSILGLLVLLTSDVRAEKAFYEKSWKSLATHQEAPAWFRDAKFGIYFHWGVYSVPEFGGEWYPCWMHYYGRKEYKHHIQTYGPIEKFGYHDFIPSFTAEHFDAEEWVDLFEKAGAKFVGPVAEHHDGFAMWNSKLTPWNAKSMGPKRDILGEIQKAANKRNMKFIASFHHARNFQRYKPVEKEQEIHWKAQWHSHYPAIKGYPTTSNDSKLQLLYGNLPLEQFNKLWLGKLKEVIDQYQPDLIWFDSWLDKMDEDIRLSFYHYYLNQAKEWNKDVVVTHKDQDAPSTISIEDFEKGRLDRLTEQAWLTDDTISNGSWCYTKGLFIKPYQEVLHILIDIVSKNGQLLLNVSPKANGIIPENQRNVLLKMGEWLKANGEAIYYTRPYNVFGEGPTRMKSSGHFVEKHGGKTKYTGKDIRYTRNLTKNTIYSIQMGTLKADESITLKALKGERIKNVTLLSTDTSVKWQETAEGVTIHAPANYPHPHANTFKITLK